jgi:hypothetical protein
MRPVYQSILELAKTRDIPACAHTGAVSVIVPSGDRLRLEFFEAKHLWRQCARSVDFQK